MPDGANPPQPLPGRPTGSRPARLRIGIVSAGRVGAALGGALARAGHEFVAASAVSAASIRRAERVLPGVPMRPADEVVAAADFVLLAVPDDALRPLITGLASTDAWRPGQLVAHTSGAHGIGVLDAAAARGVLALALHPVMTFTGRARGRRPRRRRQLRHHRAGGDAPGRRGAGGGDGRRAGVGAREPPGRCITPRSPSGPTIWSRSSTTPCRCWPRPGWSSPPGCSRRCSAPRWTTCCASATRR